MKSILRNIVLIGMLGLAATGPGRAAQITFDLNAPGPGLGQAAPPYATVTVSTQGTGTANFSIVADGPYLLSQLFFEINPAVFFKVGSFSFTGGNGGALFPISPAVASIGQFGTFDLRFDVLRAFEPAGTAASIAFTLLGPFIDVIQDVIIPSGTGFLAAALVTGPNGTGYAGGNGLPTVLAVPEPGPFPWLLAGAAGLFFWAGRLSPRQLARKLSA